MTRRYILDSGPAFDFIFRRRGVHLRAENARRSGAKIGICTPILGEIVGDLEGSTSREQSWVVARARLGKLACWPYELRAAYEYGRIIAELRRMGRPMQQIDIQLAAIAFSLRDCVVVSDDGDLCAIPGLPVESWAEPN